MLYVSIGGGGVVFQMGDFIFELGVHPMGRDISFDGGVFEKKRRMRGPLMPPTPVVRS